jgi:hypothetical protein
MGISAGLWDTTSRWGPRQVALKTAAPPPTAATQRSHSYFKWAGTTIRRDDFIVSDNFLSALTCIRSTWDNLQARDAAISK